jgi:hypothetical protein
MHRCKVKDATEIQVSEQMEKQWNVRRPYKNGVHQSMLFVTCSHLQNIPEQPEFESSHTQICTCLLQDCNYEERYFLEY